jgi:hypothetical protein
MPWSLLKINRRFGEAYLPHLQDRRKSQVRNQCESKQSSALWFFAWFFLGPWRWRRYDPPKRRLTFNGLHGFITQKIQHFITTGVRTLNPAQALKCSFVDYKYLCINWGEKRMLRRMMFYLFIVYLRVLSLSRTIRCRMIRWLMNDNLGWMTKESEFDSRQNILLFFSVQTSFKPMKCLIRWAPGNYFPRVKRAGVKLTSV